MVAPVPSTNVADQIDQKRDRAFARSLAPIAELIFDFTV